MSAGIPNKQKALLVTEKCGPWAVREIDVPSLKAGEVLVRAEAVGLNPADLAVQKTDHFNSTYPAILGLEAAGVVVKLGEGVTSPAVGDTVFHPGSNWTGYPTFRQYNVAVADLCAKVPANLTIDQAGTVPVAFDTAALGLYCQTENNGGAALSPPWEEGGRGKYSGQPILILGGSTSVGQAAIQFARLSGFSPIVTTASLRNAELLKSLGATHVIDRHVSGPDFTAAVQAIVKEPFHTVYNASSSEEMQMAAYELLASGHVYVTCVRTGSIREELRTTDKPVTFVFGSPFWEDRRQLAVGLFKALPALFESGDLKPNNVEVVPGGFRGAPDALKRMGRGEVSARKLVVHPQETA